MRGQYSKSAEVRRRILNGCIEAFAETGFYGANMKDIARRSGISYTGLLHHFPNKEILLAAVLELREEQSVAFLRSAEALDAGVDPMKALHGMLAVVVESELKPGLMELNCVLSGEATAPDHPAHDYFARRSRAARGFYTEVFATLARQGRLRSAADPATLATMTVALIGGLQSQWLLDRSSVELESALRKFLHSFIPDFER